MKILMLVNWKVEYCNEKPENKQPPDYVVEGEKYWFFRYFNEDVDVDVIDVSSFKILEKIEKNKFRFYIWQTLKVLPKLGKYDLILSHGMQSGIVLSLWRRIFKTKAKHIVFDIGSFNSAAKTGLALKLMQFSSKSIDGIIYHTSSQIDYYKEFFPWIINKSKFIRFGADFGFFTPEGIEKTEDNDKYIVCVGYSKRDWDTLISAYQLIDTDIKLRVIGHVDDKYKNINNVEQLPPVSINELKRQIFNAAFCVLPLESFNYSYGQMTLMQQMALGKLVIAARVPSLVDYVGKEQCVEFYEPKDIESCKNIIKDCMDRGKEYWDIKGNQAQRYIGNECNEKIMAEEIEKFCWNFLRGGRRIH